MCHTSHQSLFRLPYGGESSTLVSKGGGGKKSSRRKTPGSFAGESLRSISWWKCLPESRLTMSDGAEQQQKSDSLRGGASCLGMSFQNSVYSRHFIHILLTRLFTMEIIQRENNPP